MRLLQPKGIYLIILVLIATNIHGQDQPVSFWAGVTPAMSYDAARLAPIYDRFLDLQDTPMSEEETIGHYHDFLKNKEEVKLVKKKDGWGEVIKAITYRIERNHDSVYVYANEAYNIALEKKDKRLQAIALNLVGVTNRDVFFGASLKAIPYHEQALELALELKDTSLIIQQYLWLGDNYSQAGNGELFLDYWEKMADIIEEKKSPFWRNIAGGFFSLFMLANNDYEKGKLISLKVIDNYKKSKPNIGIVNSIYFNLIEAAIINKNRQDVIRFYNEIQVLDATALYPEINYQVARFLGNEEEALAHLEEAYKEVSKDYMGRNAMMLSQWETRMQTQEKELLLDKQAESIKANQRQNSLLTVLLLILALATLGIIFAFTYQRRVSKEIQRQKKFIEKQAAELRALDKLKSRFFANISHELRTPLTLILGPLSSILKKSKLDKQETTFISMAHLHAKKLLTLVNEILDLSKLASNKMSLQEEDIQFYPFIRRLLSPFESHAESKDINLAFSYTTDKDLELRLDAKKFETIFNNLLSNALKFTPDGRWISVKVGTYDEVLKIEIEDSGRGILPEDLPHIFDRFYQTSVVNAPAEGGTGIGLALSKELINLLGGNIHVVSEYEEGTTFTIELPIKEVEQKVAKEEEMELADKELVEETSFLKTLPLSKKQEYTILLVEDNTHLRNYIQLILGTSYQIDTADNGKVGLDKLRANPTKYSLILSDVMMPQMDGFQLLKYVKNDDSLRHLPFILLTAKAESHDKLEALRVGVDDYMLKPFKEEELVVRVQNLLYNYTLRTAQSKVFTTTDGQIQLIDKDKSALNSFTEIEVNWLKEVETLLIKNIDNTNMTVDEICYELAISKSQLNRRIKKMTGLTPSKYFLEIRLQKAREFLERREVSSVKQATYAIGFQKPAYFSKLFKERFGKLPSEYFEV